MADYLPEREQEVTDFLEHHGVKGMRWGVIRSKASRGTRATARAIRKAGSRANSARVAYQSRKAKIKADKTKGGKRSYKKLTDTELNKRIKRLEQEQRYRDLKADRHLVRGRKVTREILENGLTKAGSYALNKALRTGFDNAFDSVAKETGSAAAKDAAADSAKKAAKKAAKKTAKATKAVKREWDSKPPASEYRPSHQVSGATAPKQIGRKKSYSQSRPTTKIKRHPRNPGGSK